MGGDDDDSDDDDDDDGETDDGDDGHTPDVDGEPVDERIDARLTLPLDDREPIEHANWNVYDPTTHFWEQEGAGRLLVSPFGLYYGNVDEYELVLGEDWEMVDDQTVEFTLRDDVYWHDGSQMTMEDHLVEMKLVEYTERVATPPDERDDPDEWHWSTIIEDYEQVDELTFRYHLLEPVAEAYVISEVLPDTDDMLIKADVGYDEFADDLEAAVEADDWDEAEEILGEFLDWRVEERYGNGPFQYADHDDTRLILELFEDHPYADDIYFTEVAFEEYEVEEEAFIEGHVDAIYGGVPFDPELEDRAPEYHVINADHFHNSQICFNTGDFDSPHSEAPEGIYDPATSDMLVRKALLWAIDREQFALAQGDHFRPFEYPHCRVPHGALEDGLHEDRLEEDFEWYGPEQDLERARGYLEEAGYTFEEEGGPEGQDAWIDEDGEPLEIRIMTPATGGSLFASEVMADNWMDLDVIIDLDAMDGTTFGGQRFEGTFDVIPDGTSVVGIRDMWPIGTWLPQLYHGDQTLDVPMPVGDPDGEIESIDTEELSTQWHINDDDEDHIELMWCWNQYSPMAEQAFYPTTGAVNAERWHVDGSDGVLGVRQGAFNLLHAPSGNIVPLEGEH